MVAALRQSLGSLKATGIEAGRLAARARRENVAHRCARSSPSGHRGETVGSLSDLASVLIHAAYEIVDKDLKAQHGTPMHQRADGTWAETEFVVIGMGKLGAHGS